MLPLVTFEATVLAMFSAGIFPAMACYLAGVRDTKQLFKIGGYAAIGWILTFSLQPAISHAEDSYLRRMMHAPMLGYDWHIPASCVSAVLALVGVVFLPAQVKVSMNESSESQPERPTSSQ